MEKIKVSKLKSAYKDTTDKKQRYRIQMTEQELVIAMQALNDLAVKCEEITKHGDDDPSSYRVKAIGKTARQLYNKLMKA